MREPYPKLVSESEPKPMVIEISSASDLSDVTVSLAWPIEEEIESSGYASQNSYNTD